MSHTFYLAFALGSAVIGGLTLACIGLKGAGNAIYLFSGWIIGAAACAALAWWWI